MKHRFHFNRIIWITCLTILVLFSAYSFADAKNWAEKPAGKEENEESRVVTVPGGPGFISIPPTAFFPLALIDDWSFMDSALFNPSSTYNSILRAPVYLPHGAIVNKVVLYFYDDNAANNLSAELYNLALSGGNPTIMSILDSSTLMGGGYGQKTDTDIFRGTINNQNYVYYVELYFPKNCGITIRFTGLRIDYEYPGYLPCVTK